MLPCRLQAVETSVTAQSSFSPLSGNLFSDMHTLCSFFFLFFGSIFVSEMNIILSLSSLKGMIFHVLDMVSVEEEVEKRFHTFQCSYHKYSVLVKLFR